MKLPRVACASLLGVVLSALSWAGPLADDEDCPKKHSMALCIVDAAGWSKNLKDLSPADVRSAATAAAKSDSMFNPNTLDWA
jgi:hypothetical protein